MARTAPRRTGTSAPTGWRVDDRAGRRVGMLAAVYEDPQSGEPAWFLVRLERFSTRFVVAPPADVLAWRGAVSLPYDRLLIERAPVLYAVPAQIDRGLAEQARAHFRLAAAGGPDALRVIARRSVA